MTDNALKSSSVPTWQISKGVDRASHQYTDVPVYNCNGPMALFQDDRHNVYVSKKLTGQPVRIAFAE